MPWFAPELQSLLAVVVATLGEDGMLIEANAGFLKLIGASVPPALGMRVARFFIQPDFAAVMRAPVPPDGTVHRGLLTMGNYTGQTWSLRAHLWRTDRRLRLLAEYDIEELERLNNTILELNREYARTQLELAQTNLKLQQREAQILTASLTDPLTGVGNRRRLEQAMEFEISRANRTGGMLAICIADIDRFKRVNDDYGHESGDRVLAAFGHLLVQLTRDTDIVSRFGGEEFVVLMPDTDLSQAAVAADRIRAAFASHRVEPITDPVTASFGVAELVAGEPGDALLRRADNALYRAKQLGRNRIAQG